MFQVLTTAILVGLAGPAHDDDPGEALAPELLALFDYDRGADLDLREEEIESFDGFDRIDLSFASPFESASKEAGERVPAYLYQPHSDGPWAGMLLMHGMPGDRSDGRGLAEGYVRSGCLVLAISAPWARSVPMDPMTMTAKDRENQIQLIQDLRRGVDLLRSFPEVDSERLAYLGVSYGGAMGGLLAGVERRIEAYALVVGDGGLVAHMTSPGDEIPPEDVTEEEWLAWVEAMAPIEPIRFVAHARPAHLLFQNGKTDRLVPAADAEAYQAAASEPKTLMWYEGGHAVDGARLRDQALWFAERIGIDPTPFTGP